MCKPPNTQRNFNYAQDGTIAIHILCKQCLLLLNGLSPIFWSCIFQEPKRHYDTIPLMPIVYVQGLVAQSMVIANDWSGSMKSCASLWYLMLFSTNHALSNSGQDCKHAKFWQTPQTAPIDLGIKPKYLFVTLELEFVSGLSLVFLGYNIITVGYRFCLLVKYIVRRTLDDPCCLYSSSQAILK